MERFLLEIITPRGVAVKEEVEELVAPGYAGEFGVLPGHAHLIAALKMGILSYRSEGRRRYLAIGDGYAEVSPDAALLLIEEAVTPEEIDLDRGQEEKRELQARLSKLKGDEEEYQPLLRSIERLSIREEVARRVNP